MSHSKTNKASKMSKTGKFPSTFAACLDHIPHDLRQTLTGKQLAAVVDIVAGTYQAGKLAADREAVRNGCVWDENREMPVDFAV